MHTDGRFITVSQSARSASQRVMRDNVLHSYNADCRLRTGGKMKTEGKMHTADYRLFKRLLCYCVSESLHLARLNITPVKA